MPTCACAEMHTSVSLLDFYCFRVQMMHYLPCVSSVPGTFINPSVNFKGMNECNYDLLYWSFGFFIWILWYSKWCWVMHRSPEIVFVGFWMAKWWPSGTIQGPRWPGAGVPSLSNFPLLPFTNPPPQSVSTIPPPLHLANISLPLSISALFSPLKTFWQNSTQTPLNSGTAQCPGVTKMNGTWSLLPRKP